ncbi:hypothetical protein Tco_0688330 [Tanacetum coccineum]
MSVKYPNYVNLTSSSEEQPNERTPSPPPRKKSLSPPQAPSKSISSKSTHYTSSSSPTPPDPPNALHESRGWWIRSFRHCRGVTAYNWETATYGKIWENEDVHDLGYVETEFPSIVFNDTLTSEAALSCEPTVSSLNNKIDFRISFDESDDEDCTVDIATYLVEYVKFWYDWEVDRYENANLAYSTLSSIWRIQFTEYGILSYLTVKMDDLDITMEEYIRLEEEKAHRCGKVYNWETATYGKIWDNEDVLALKGIPV